MKLMRMREVEEIVERTERAISESNALLRRLSGRSTHRKESAGSGDHAGDPACHVTNREVHGGDCRKGA